MPVAGSLLFLLAEQRAKRLIKNLIVGIESQKKQVDYSLNAQAL